MARCYKVRGPTTYVDGDPLDAWTARTLIQTNGEAVYEEARDDGRVILQAYHELTDTTEPWGPMPIRVCMDRSGRWRTQYVDLLFAPGGYDKLPVRAVITDTYRWPVGDGATFPPTTVGDVDPYVEWTPDAGTTPAWLGAQAIVLPRDWAPSIVERGAEAERGRMRLAWLSVWIMDTPTGDDPRFAGLRHYESIEDEP